MPPIMSPLARSIALTSFPARLQRRGRPVDPGQRQPEECERPPQATLCQDTEANYRVADEEPLE